MTPIAWYSAWPFHPSVTKLNSALGEQVALNLEWQGWGEGHPGDALEYMGVLSGSGWAQQAFEHFFSRKALTESTKDQSLSQGRRGVGMLQLPIHYCLWAYGLHLNVFSCSCIEVLLKKHFKRIYKNSYLKSFRKTVWTNGIFVNVKLIGRTTLCFEWHMYTIY